MSDLMFNEIDAMLSTTELSPEEIARLTNATISVVYSRLYYEDIGDGCTARRGGYVSSAYDFDLDEYIELILMGGVITDD